MKDKIGDKQHHTIDGNIYWYFGLCVSFSFHFGNALIDDLYVPTLSRLRSSRFSRASLVGRVYQLILTIFHVLLHMPRSEETI